jgi:hypothetical protein
VSFADRLALAVQIMTRHPDPPPEVHYVIALLTGHLAEQEERDLYFNNPERSIPSRAITPSQVRANNVAHDIIRRYGPLYMPNEL